VSRWIAGAALALMSFGCAAPPQPRPASSPASVEQRLEAINAAARRSEQERDATVRVGLAEDARGQAEACLAQEPQAAACLYGDALALGLEARAHPAHAGVWLGKMLAQLTAAEAADPGYDRAGPARVRALVLTRAPGWPLGPGDPAAGVVAAQRAVSLRPQYPPNHLALAEALAKSGDAQAAREAYQRAREEALAQPAGSERDEWLREADRGLPR
jgi:tetratricopeptide (TPR) repeat protein